MRRWLHGFEDVWAFFVASLIILAVIMFFAGCVSVNVSPSLPLPEAPALHFTACQPQMICLAENDANNLRKWMDALNAYKHATERLQQVTP